MSDDDADKSATTMDWKVVGKRTFAEFMGDKGTDLAAALTYYSMMSIFPMILAISTSLSFIGQGDATNEAIADLGSDLGMRDSTISTVQDYLASMSGSGGAGILLIVGLLGSLWSASNYVNAFSRMMNTVYGIDEGRPIWKLRPWLLALTVLVMLMLMTIVLSVTLSGTLSEAIFGLVGLDETATMVWNIAKWPVILVILMTIVSLLYWGTPNVRQPKFRLLAPGAILAVIMAILAGAGFFVYAMNAGSYNATYGALGGVIILLLMVWLINTSLAWGRARRRDRARQGARRRDGGRGRDPAAAARRGGHGEEGGQAGRGGPRGAGDPHAGRRGPRGRGGGDRAGGSRALAALSRLRVHAPDDRRVSRAHPGGATMVGVARARPQAAWWA
ncbi:hypothetical protein BJF82_15045 [Kytococcus sp. CUA-901]|nr:hypothetical protein BJF82_15045 [Kytococcus sp. CUA-901]